MAIVGCFFAIHHCECSSSEDRQNFFNPAIAPVLFAAHLLYHPDDQMAHPRHLHGGAALSAFTARPPLPDDPGHKAQILLSGNVPRRARRFSCETAIFAMPIGWHLPDDQTRHYPAIRFFYWRRLPVFVGGRGQTHLSTCFRAGVVLGAIFMATDLSTSPTTEYESTYLPIAAA
jgi:hypothetical protein